MDGFLEAFDMLERGPLSPPPNVLPQTELDAPSGEPAIEEFSPQSVTRRQAKAERRKKAGDGRNEKRKLTASLARTSLAGVPPPPQTAAEKVRVAPHSHHKEYQQVTELAKQMANGCFLIATRCH